jgi:hypothetical protein
MRKIPGIRIEDLYWIYDDQQTKAGHDIAGCGHDQSFLALYVYPLLAPRLLIHYSNKCLLAGETGVEFPFAWNNETFCGRGEVGVFLDVPDPPHAKPIQRNSLPLKLNEGRLHYPLL